MRNLALAPETWANGDRALVAALGPATAAVRQAVIFVEDTNGPDRGGVDKRCRVMLRLVSGREVVTEEVDEDPDALVVRATERAGALARRVLTAQSRRRPGRIP